MGAEGARLTRSHDGVLLNGSLIFRCPVDDFKSVPNVRRGAWSNEYPFVFRVRVFGMRLWCVVRADGRVYAYRSPACASALAGITRDGMRALM